MNRWQTLIDLNEAPQPLNRLVRSCAESLIHAADVAGLCGGIDAVLVALLWGRGVRYADLVAWNARQK